MAENRCGAWQGILSTYYHIPTEASREGTVGLQSQQKSWQDPPLLHPRVCRRRDRLNFLVEETAWVWKQGSAVFMGAARVPVEPSSECWIYLMNAYTLLRETAPSKPCYRKTYYQAPVDVLGIPHKCLL